MHNKQERQIKHDRLRTYLESHNLDGVLLSRRCNFSWYTCGAHNHVRHTADEGCSWLLVDQDGAKVLTSNIEATRLRGEELADSGIEVVEFPYYDPAATAEAFKAVIGSMKLATDVPGPAVAAAQLDGDFDQLRWQLTDAEMERYRALATDTVAAVEAAARRVQPGQSENTLAGMVAAELHDRNCSPWVLLVGADQRVVEFRHPLPTARRVEKYFMLIACSERTGLIHSCSRLASFGPVAEDLAAKHQAVANVDAALICSTRPGAKLRDIYAAGQAAYQAQGYPEQWKLHHQGGSCGYLPRDVVADPTQQAVALASQAFAWNPSITGTKSEDTMLCHEDGPEVMGASDDWPTVLGQWQGQTLPRAAILEL